VDSPPSPDRDAGDTEAAPPTVVAGGASRPPRALAVAIVAIIAAGTVTLVLLSSHSGGSSQPAGAAAISTDPQSFALPRLTGSGQVRLADFRGKPVVVNFFASWCVACRGEAPGFVHAAAELRGRVAFVGVNSFETEDGAAFARELGYDAAFTLARDVGGTQDSGLHDALGQIGMPITAFYDKTGRLLYVAPGALSEDALLSKLHELYRVP